MEGINPPAHRNIVRKGVLFQSTWNVTQGGTAMDLAQRIFEQTRNLPEAMQQEVLDFALFLKQKERRVLDDAMDQVITDNLEALKALAK